MNLDQARRFALSLPEALEAPHFELTSFRVRGKIFATATADEAFLHVFLDPAEVEVWAALEPGACERLLWGQKVAGLRVRLAKAKAALVKDLLQAAWTRKAPKGLVKGLGAPPP